MAKKVQTYTVLEDQPHLDRWDVEIRQFRTYQAAISWVTAYYDKEDLERLTPHVRNDLTGEIE